MRRRHCALGLSLVAALASVAAVFAAQQDKSPQPPNDLVVHEWGTFLAIQGSDGASLDGMYHEEHALPDFVHARSRDQLRLAAARLKGETPVIYFYTKHQQRVGVEVRFPSGIWTQWYPQASLAAPSLASLGSALDLRNGRIAWNVELRPPRDGVAEPSLPATSDDALWNFARDVDAAYVRGFDQTRKPAPAENERFIFYRGLGRAPLPLKMTQADGGTLRSLSSDGMELLHVFVLRVENGRGAYNYFSALDAGQTRSHVIPDMDHSLPLDEFTDKIADDLAGRLTGGGLYSKEHRLTANKPESPAGEFHWSGLYPKEARAMVNTWRSSYFQTDGIRVLFVLPERWTDRFIPMNVHPAPNEITRVMVGRLEALTPERERLAENAVRDLASPDPLARARAFDYLREQGRYVEPIVRRVLATTRDESVRTLAKRLLLTDFVTELRSALNLAGDGTRVAEKPVFVQAKLASLLRSIGFDDEAKHEAEQALAKLANEKVPPLTQHDARHYLRAHARATEGSGDDAAAAESYARFIRFASQVTTTKNCRACHDSVGGPTNMAWFRDWWAGGKYAQATARAGATQQSIKNQQAAVAVNPKDAAAQMMLAYLYESVGDHDNATAAWAKLGVPARRDRPSVAAR